MAIFLLVIGLLATAAGFVIIGFGIPINAFSLGNTLILAGTITVSTGLILIGLAAAVGQLRRVVEALGNRSGARATVRTPESSEIAVAPAVKVTAAVPIPAPKASEAREAPEPRLPESRLSESRLSEHRLAEPRLPEPPQPEARPAPGPLDWLRAKPKPSASQPVTADGMPSSPPPPSAAEPPVIEDEAPLSPRPPQRQAPPTPAIDPTLEPRVWSPPSRSASAEPRPAPTSRATPQAEPPKTKDDFDLVWPDRGEQSDPARREPEAPRPPMATRPRESRPVTPRPAQPAPAAPPEQRGPAILKSGVIDGMPYTLYADGSIEAELSQGTVRFASVDALRAHLEKQS